MSRMPGKDTKTRYQGVFARHQQDCAIARGGRCTCKPSYYGVAYDRSRQRHVKTKRMPTAEAARNARADLAKTLERGEAPVTNAVRLRDARERFVAAAREGKALNKHGHRYKPRAIDNVDESLRLHVEPVLGHKRLSDIRRGDVQAIIDELAPKLSGSRVRSIVNAVRSLYRWAQDRDLAGHDPAALVRLPAMDATPIERVASPAEFADLLAALPLEKALPYALAGYGMGRRAQIVRLCWQEVDLKVGAIEWGLEWEARKYEASRRVVPTVPPLLAMLKRAYLEQGRPSGKQRVCPAGRSKPIPTARLVMAWRVRAQDLGRGEADPDHAAGVATHGRHLAGRRRCPVLRSRLCLWATLLRRANPALHRSPSRDTRMRCRKTSSGRASS